VLATYRTLPEYVLTEYCAAQPTWVY
jgi:hypothetical protein